MENRRIGIACSNAALEDFRYARGFKFLKQELMKYGYQLELAIWDDSSIEWRHFSLILVMGMTDNPELMKETQEWLIQADKRDIPIYNRPQTIKWNMHKGYLLQLAQLGVAIPYTVMIRRQANPEDVTAALRELRSKCFTEYIVKPAIGRDGQRITTATDLDLDAKVRHILLIDDVIIQEYISCVPTNGEVCVHFFGGQYNGSCIRKRPINPDSGKIDINDVQRFTSGAGKLVDAAEHVYKCAKSIISPEEDFLYARVDLMEDLDTGRILLNEFEIFEPLISYDGSNTEAVALAREIVRKIGI